MAEEIAAEFAALDTGPPVRPAWFQRISAKAERDAALVQAGAGFYACRYCYRDFLSLTKETFCSKRCRLRANAKRAGKLLSTEAQATAVEAVQHEPVEPVWDPRRGRYRTTSWAKLGLPD